MPTTATTATTTPPVPAPAVSPSAAVRLANPDAEAAGCPDRPNTPDVPNSPNSPDRPNRTAAPDAVRRAGGPLPVLGLDVRVPLAGGGEVEYAALDYAASAPVLRPVWDAVAEYAPYYGSVHRGAGQLSRLSTELFEESRATVARFLGCRADDQVVFTRSTTDALNLLARAVPAGTRVFVFETEHHAALLPWRGRDTVWLPAPGSPDEAVAVLEEALRAAAPAGPALVCVTGASNVTGELWPVRELAATARRFGARTVLDAAQLAPHRPVDVERLGVDWVALSGHKLYAPFGAGVLAGRADWLDAAEPYLAGGGASGRVSRPARGGVEVEWRTGPARHEAGSPNVIGARALAVACEALTGADFPRLVRRERALTAWLLDELARVPGVRVLSLFGPAADRVGVVSFVLAGWDSARLAATLAEEFGIGVRDGLFCAHPLVTALLGPGGADSGPDSGPGSAPLTGDGAGPEVAGPPPAGRPAPGAGPDARPGVPLSAVRVSFGVGTPDGHLARFLDAVREVAARG
ncbi:aminotransferase class V-fold PLP-dependent enzyme [Streptomyces sp. AJS327]|uniref:aminotransferase class V-fold PLP-dependent enzyme n=1 Tax=Streptomyces sp. AJS327 TaxID=2545265 RepID=UPI0015DF4980|nr:aminotransferase class V-fold PLP-dependent enzyme [Streptomyces sp. AJS327]MBA0050275.1 aminotransferase class V-fold PLP-dependent enzyme [Streptomyces sp. AJS327]